jgi:hypothetical protein
MFGFVTFFEPFLWKQVWNFWKQKKEILARKQAMKKRVKPSRIEKFMRDSF